MEDSTVRQPNNDRLNPRLQELASSTNSMLQTLTKGRNLRAEVMKQYDNGDSPAFQS
ncbi:hypothetical protein [Massilia timonae]|nr:hypothetical protein [Massilia timonae]